MRVAAGDKKQSNRSVVSHSAAAADPPTDRWTARMITNYQAVRFRPILYSNSDRKRQWTGRNDAVNVVRND